MAGFLCQARTCATALVAAALVAVSACATPGGSNRDADIAAEYYAIAEGYAGLSKYDKAAEYYRKAARRKEYANAASYGLARAYALSGKWTDARDTLAPLYAQDTGNRMLSSAYAFALASSGETKKAVELYSELWRAVPDDPQTGRNYAEILFVAGSYGDALALAEDLQKRFPDVDALKGLDDLVKKAKDKLAAPEPAGSVPQPDGAVPPPAGSVPQPDGR